LGADSHPDETQFEYRGGISLGNDEHPDSVAAGKRSKRRRDEGPAPIKLGGKLSLPRGIAIRGQPGVPGGLV
jgi:hypothetical protein